MEKRCGLCAHWGERRNVGRSEAPVYYAECKYPVDDLKLPHCVSFEETGEHNGTACPCFKPSPFNFQATNHE